MPFYGDISRSSIVRWFIRDLFNTNLPNNVINYKGREHTGNVKLIVNNIIQQIRTE